MECRVELQECNPDRAPECSGARPRGLVGGGLAAPEESDQEQWADNLSTPASRAGELYSL